MIKINPKVCRKCAEKNPNNNKQQLDDMERYIFTDKWKMCVDCPYKLEHTVING